MSSALRASLAAVAVICLALGCSEAISASFVDSAGRSVELPAHVEKVVPAGPPADVLLYALASEKLAALVHGWSPRQAAYVTPFAKTLPVIPRLTHATDEKDIAAIAALHPDLVVDYGDITPGYKDTANKTQAALATPTLLISGALPQVPDVMRRLGGILGVPERGAKLADLASAALARIKPASSLAQEARVSIYLARGGDGLQAVRPGTQLDEAIALAGGRNVVPAGPGGFAKLAVDDVVKLSPRVVIFESEAALKSPLKAALPPDTRIFVDRGLPFGAMEEPPSVNRLVGAVALAMALYPDLVPKDEVFLRSLREGLFSPLPEGASVDPLAAH